MKKKVSTLLALAILAISSTALAAPADVSSTSNFTISVVQETLGLNIYGTTNIPEVISRSNYGLQTIDFTNLSIENSGNTKGVLYGELLPPTGVSYSSGGNGNIVMVFAESSPLFMNSTTPVETKLDGLLNDIDSDGEGDYLGPKERSKPFKLSFSAQDKFPAGNLQMPVKWTMKAN